MAVLFRINNGGPEVVDTPVWAVDTNISPDPNRVAGGSNIVDNTRTIDMTDPSIPEGTPATLFADERWDQATAPEMQWEFPVAADTEVTVRLFFAETFITGPGLRLFDVTIDGVLVLNNYDIFADVGADKAVAKTFTVVSDGTIDIDFGHVVENPKINAIEIAEVPPPAENAGEAWRIPELLGALDILTAHGVPEPRPGAKRV